MPSKPRKWRFRLRHIAEAVQRIVQYTRGMTYEQFCADQKTVDAVVRNFMIVGEAARHVPRQVESEYPEVP